MRNDVIWVNKQNLFFLLKIKAKWPTLLQATIGNLREARAQMSRVKSPHHSQNRTV